MLILCDFDGTLVEHDITNIIWDHYLGPDWRERLLPPFRAGNITSVELMATGYKAISASEKELIEFARPYVKYRHGFDSFVESCARRSWPLHVVSNGLDWYIRRFLNSKVPFHSLVAKLNGSWEVSLPANVDLKPGQDYKVFVLEKLKIQHPNLPTVFIGDGRNDFSVAKACDRVFAVKESTLARLCAESGTDCVEFSTFDEVAEGLH